MRLVLIRDDGGLVAIEHAPLVDVFPHHFVEPRVVVDVLLVTDDRR